MIRRGQSGEMGVTRGIGGSSESRAEAGAYHRAEAETKAAQAETLSREAAAARTAAEAEVSTMVSESEAQATCRSTVTIERERVVVYAVNVTCRHDALSRLATHNPGAPTPKRPHAHSKRFVRFPSKNSLSTSPRV